MKSGFSMVVIAYSIIGRKQIGVSMRKLLLCIMVMMTIRLMGIELSQIGSRIIPLPDQYILNHDRVGSKSSIVFDGKYLFITTYTDERVKPQELLSENTEINKRYVLRIDTLTGDVQVVGKPGAYTPDGYMLISHIMLDGDEFYIKTAGQFNVYDKHDLNHKYNCSIDISTNNHAILYQDRLYTTSNDPGNSGEDKIGAILYREADPEFKPDMRFSKPRYMLPYRKYLKLFHLSDLKTKLAKSMDSMPTELELRMAESYRSEAILQDWSFLVNKDVLYCAPSFGTDIYTSDLNGDSSKCYPLKNFKKIRKTEIDELLNKQLQGAKFSRLSNIYADSSTDNILLYYSISEYSRKSKECFGAISLWSIDKHKELGGLCIVDFSPVAIDKNVITGLKVANTNDLELVQYVIGK